MKAERLIGSKAGKIATGVLATAITLEAGAFVLRPNKAIAEPRPQNLAISACLVPGEPKTVIGDSAYKSAETTIGTPAYYDPNNPDLTIPPVIGEPAYYDPNNPDQTTPPQPTVIGEPWTYYIFDDVPEGSPYKDAIYELQRKQVFNGYNEHKFGINDPITRQQMAKVIVRAFAIPVSEEDRSIYADVENSGSGSFYPDNFIAAVTKAGLMVGTGNGQFDPYRPISREEMLTVLARAIKKYTPVELQEAANQNSLNGIRNVSEAHLPTVEVAIANGITSGLNLSSGWDANAGISRGEAAQVIYNAISLGNK